MEKERISASQMFKLVFLFELGSAIVVGLGMQAKQDAWLAILLGMVGGLLLLLVYSYLYHQFSQLPLTGYLPKILGKYPGYLVGLLYILYFIYLAARVLRDSADLLLTASFTKTPMIAINALMILIIGYAVYLGIESIARASEILVIFIMAYGIMGNLLLAMSGVIEVNNLAPVLENGLKQIVATAFPLTMTFPFGEMIVFAMLFPYLNRRKKGMKAAFSAVILSGFVLSLTVAVEIAVLGPFIVETSVFPLLKTVEKINVGNFIQRLDPIVISTLIIGSFFKITIFFYAAVQGISDIFKLQKKRTPLIILVGIVIMIGAIRIASNLPQHLEIGLEIVPYYLHLIFQVVFPFLLFLIVLIRKRWLPGKPSS